MTEQFHKIFCIKNSEPDHHIILVIKKAQGDLNKLHSRCCSINSEYDVVAVVIRIVIAVVVAVVAVVVVVVVVVVAVVAVVFWEKRMADRCCQLQLVC